MAIKYEAGETENLIAQIQQLWKEFEVDNPVNYTFLDQNFEKLVEKTGFWQKLYWYLLFLHF